MKKLVGILGIAAIAITMFFSVSALNSSNGDVDLASIINMNIANAECPQGQTGTKTVVILETSDLVYKYCIDGGNDCC